MRTVQPLCGEVTIPADDPAWSKQSHIPGQPKPIPPRNEPLLYIPNIHNNPHTSLDERSINDCELGNHLASAVAQAAQEIQDGVHHHETRDAEPGKPVSAKQLYTLLICLRFAFPE
jgi:hypothetical protein